MSISAGILMAGDRVAEDQGGCQDSGCFFKQIVPVGVTFLAVALVLFISCRVKKRCMPKKCLSKVRTKWKFVKC